MKISLIAALAGALLQGWAMTPRALLLVAVLMVLASVSVPPSPCGFWGA